MAANKRTPTPGVDSESRNDKLDFPTIEQVHKASHEMLARWYRFLIATDESQQETLRRVAERLQKLGGITPEGGLTPELSKKVGYGGVKDRR
jgi:hypothetical protein